MNNTQQKPQEDTELRAMNHWTKLVDSRKAPQYKATGKPVVDPSSRPAPK